MWHPVHVWQIWNLDLGLNSSSQATFSVCICEISSDPHITQVHLRFSLLGVLCSGCQIAIHDPSMSPTDLDLRFLICKSEDAPMLVRSDVWLHSWLLIVAVMLVEPLTPVPVELGTSQVSPPWNDRPASHGIPFPLPSPAGVAPLFLLGR